MCYFSLLYKATKCYAEFVVNALGISLHVEIPVRLHGSEVGAQRPVSGTRNSNVLAAEDVRVTLLARISHFLLEDIVILPVVSQKAHIHFTHLSSMVRAEDSLNVHAQFCVVVKYLFHILFYRYKVPFQHLHDDIERRSSSRAHQSRAQFLTAAPPSVKKKSSRNPDVWNSCCKGMHYCPRNL